MKTTLKILFATGLIAFMINTTSAQTSDSTYRRNTIKLDLTSYWLYRNAVVFSYERVVKKQPYQTWGITAGYQQFPSSTSYADTIRARREFKAAGFKVGGEYRFYLKKENKYPAPRGVFIGPYVSYHYYTNGRSFEIDNNGTIEHVDLTTRLNIINFGVQLGYQFVVNNRWAIDLSLIGPSISQYKFKASLDGNYTFDPEDITNEVILKMMERFPAFDKLISENEVRTNGRVSTWAYGWRYQIQVGYRFNKKNK
jgi:hypothetical protein